MTRRRRGERGALTPAVMVMAIALLLLGGLVTDGGRQLNVKLRAQSTAEEAARAGATMTDPFTANATIDPEKAAQRVAAYCQQAMAEDSSIDTCEFVGVGQEQVSDELTRGYVEARVVISESPLLFGLLGMSDLEADASAKSNAIKAITDPYHDALQPDFSIDPVYPTSTVTLTTTDGEAPPVTYTATVTTVQTCGFTTVVPTGTTVTCPAPTPPTTKPTKPTKPPPDPPTTQDPSTPTTGGSTPTSTSGTGGPP